MNGSVLARLILISVFAIAVPLSSSASTVASTFLTSSTGTSNIGTSDTIQFEVTITANAGQNYNTIFWSLTGDISGALGSTPESGWAGVSNMVVDWEWNYTPTGTSQVDMGVTATTVPFPPPAEPPDRVTGPYGFLAQNTTGTGIPSLVGTVTIHADAAGQFLGGGFQYPGIDGFAGSAGFDTVTVSSAAFTVVPETSTAILVCVGMAGIAVARRRDR